MSLLRFHFTSQPTMDYLTVFATRSLVLFPRTPASIPPLFPSSPKATSRSLTPPPVEMPLYALMRDDTHCAWYLVDRVLEATRATGAVHRDLELEAEVMVWEQIDRAKMFGRALALLFGTSSNVSEDEVHALAAKHGLGLVGPPAVVRGVVQKHYHDEAPSPILA